MMFHPKGPSFFELARQALSSTETGYDLLAPKFDYTPFRTPTWLLDVAVARLGRFAPFGSLLDVCCGTGAAMQAFAPLCRERLVGIDMSQGMLDVARVNLRSEPKPCEFIRANVLDMPFEEQFDLAVCFGALGHILPCDQGRLVAQIHRALRPGGRFVFVTHAMPSVWSPRYWLSRGFNAAMHIRNWLIDPPFVMYYLTFLLPEARVLLEQHGFDYQADCPFDGSNSALHLIVATRSGC